MTGKSYFPKLNQAVMDLIPTEYLMLSNCSSHGTASCDYSIGHLWNRQHSTTEQHSVPTLFVRAYKEQQQGDYNIIICGFASPLKTKHLKSGRLKNRCTLTAECNINENVAEEPAWKPACVVPLKKKILASTHKTPETAGGMQQEVWWRRASCLCYMFSDSNW